MENNIKCEIITKYNNNISANKISKEMDINISTVMRILRKNSVPIRSISENVNYYLDKDCNKENIVPSDELIEIIIGNLLGDGSLHKSKIRVSYIHTDKHLEYLEWLKTKFENCGIVTHVYSKAKGNGCYNLQTNSYNFLIEYRKIFYSPKRIVPNNIILTPTILRQWYISDGSCGNKRGGLHIAKTPCNNMLLQQLQSIFSKDCSYHFDKNSGYGKYYIPSTQLNKFYEYIGPSPIKCYDYKWRKNK